MSSRGSNPRPWDDHRRDDTGLISFGAFLIIIAIIYLRTPGILQEVNAFVRDFRLIEIFQNFYWFVPSTNHPLLYAAAEQFCYAFGLVHVGILGLELAKGSSTHRKAKTSSDIIFWLGSGYLLRLLSQDALTWLSFIAGLIVLIGVSIVVRALVLTFASRRSP